MKGYKLLILDARSSSPETPKFCRFKWGAAEFRYGFLAFYEQGGDINQEGRMSEWLFITGSVSS
jgi:hypothetical protein